MTRYDSDMVDRSRDWFRQAERDVEFAVLARDAYYAAPRCPNGHPEGAPFEHYGRLQADQALEYANEIIDFVRSEMA